MQEVWKDIIGYEKYYQISNKGNIYSKRKKIKIDHTKYINNAGYRYVNLWKNGIQSNFRIHRLVATHFVENTQDNKYVNHIDNNKLNNSVDNLEWTTQSSNILQAYKSGSRDHCLPDKKILQFDLEGNFIKEWKSITEAGKNTNTNRVSISYCASGKQKRAGSFIWKYK